jgi:hypothetical protein
MIKAGLVISVLLLNVGLGGMFLWGDICLCVPQFFVPLVQELFLCLAD